MIDEERASSWSLALTAASLPGQWEAFQLVSFAVDARKTTRWGETALHRSVASNHKQMADWLLAQCPDLSKVPDARGDTPVDWAANYARKGWFPEGTSALEKE